LNSTPEEDASGCQFIDAGDNSGRGRPPLFLERVVVGEITDITIEGREDSQPLQLRRRLFNNRGEVGIALRPENKDDLLAVCRN